MEPKQLSQELRQGDSPDLAHRRWIIGLSMLGGSMGQLVTLYQSFASLALAVLEVVSAVRTLLGQGEEDTAASGNQ